MGETITSGIEKVDQRRQKTVDRITGRVRQAFEAGDMDYDVRGGWLGLILTRHDPSIYADVAERLGEESGLDIEVHAFATQKPITASGELFATHTQVGEQTIIHERVMVVADQGIAVERDQHPGPGHLGQVYPPEN